jgi:ribosomal protein S18 acetylase RimI-like enzyme
MAMTAHDRDNEQHHNKKNSEQATLQFNVNLTIGIRQATKDDIKLLEWNGQYKHYRNLFRRSFKEQVQGRRYLLVADHNGYPVGRLFVQFKGRNRAMSDGAIRGYLYSFRVLDGLQGCGVGTRLIHAAEDVLLAQQFQVATIAVVKDNAGALRLYRRHGYEVFDEDDGKWHYHDHRGRIQHVYEPAWLLAKVLV